MPYVTVDAEVWIDPDEYIEDATDEDLIHELVSRGYNTPTKIRSGEALSQMVREVTVQDLYELKKVKSPDFDRAFAEYVWNLLGKTV